MKCAKCGAENKPTSKFCGECGAGLAAPKGGRPAPAKPVERAEADVPAERFWTPDLRWHAVALASIYAGLVVVYFALSLFLSKLPEPYRLRDVPKETTPWLKR